MALHVSSRRKQAKPQRLADRTKETALVHEDRRGEEAIDLSTRTTHPHSILEDKSNLFSLANSTLDGSRRLLPPSSQTHLLSLCSQLADKSPPSPSKTSRQLRCCSSDCGLSFRSRGALLWHILERHGKERLLECPSCNVRFADFDQLEEHECSISRRARSAGLLERASSPDADRGSVPASRMKPFDMIHEECESATEAPPAMSFISELFPSEPALDLSVFQLRGPSLPFVPSFAQQTPHMLMPGFDSTRPPPVSASADLFLQRSANEVLNNDDDWEALMEVSTTDEQEKIRALVGDKALPTTDPNQCLLCRRVLSCKSALQMHYRTHTGERPFKCKICQRAFTTKGNLKTHMGVHRAKHSFRGLASSSPAGLPHPCPICPRRLPSAPLLQQHIAQHTTQLTRNGLLSAPAVSLPSMEPRPVSVSTSSRPSLPFAAPGFPLFPGLLGFPATSTESFVMSPLMDKEKETPKASSASSTSSDPVAMLGRLSSCVSPSMDRPPRTEDREPPREKAELSPAASQGEVEDTEGLDVSSSSGTASARAESEEPPKDGKEDKERENPLDAMQKMWAQTEPPPPRQLPVLSKHQCAVCFKHFSSSSALQIHMRTHTGDKPFKCDVCGRAFTTRGNLKVHMGTHQWSQNPSRRGRRIFDLPGGESTPPLAVAPPAFPLFAPNGVPPGQQLDTMLWLWRTVCSVCQKVCQSPAELEQHLKAHLSGSLGDSSPSLLLSQKTD